ncbi:MULTISPECIES: four helix bundle protein [Clostridium]|uniref:four helix bundle protein n=1 Tax=Clostridium sp. ATCC 25772 TaxID=1676991 RepID=UPI000781BE99|nr:four helix bundle protein [Clostridium sp. ATCC 25772]
MFSNSIIEKKSFDFAIDAVEIYKFLIGRKREFVLSKQFLRSATSIGANVNEALRGQSKKDFLAKMYIAFKEASESIYWIKLLTVTDYLDDECGEELLLKCEELFKILNSIIKTTKTTLDS